jgi:hypothetical protein
MRRVSALKSEMGDGDGWHEDNFCTFLGKILEKHLMMRCQ